MAPAHLSAALTLLLLLFPQVCQAQLGADHANSRPMSSRFRYSADAFPVAAANQAYRREVGQLLQKRELTRSDYREVARLVFASELAAQAEIREATKLWQEGRLEESGWKDTAMVGPNEILRVIARFDDYTGLYAYHCHILEHEDHEMMQPASPCWIMPLGYATAVLKQAVAKKELEL